MNNMLKTVILILCLFSLNINYSAADDNQNNNQYSSPFWDGVWNELGKQVVQKGIEYSNKLENEKNEKLEFEQFIKQRVIMYNNARFDCQIDNLMNYYAAGNLNIDLSTKNKKEQQKYFAARCDSISKLKDFRANIKNNEINIQYKKIEDDIIVGSTYIVEFSFYDSSKQKITTDSLQTKIVMSGLHSYKIFREENIPFPFYK